MVSYDINGTTYNKGYYLADGIYPSWPVLIKTLQHATDPAGKLLSKLQEAARKDIEQAFGALQHCWGMINQPFRLWHIDDVRQMILCAIVLHNMIVEGRSEFDPYLNTSETVNTPHIQANHRDPSLHYTLASMHQNHILLR